MPYREPSPPTIRRSVVEYGRFHLAWVRLSIFAVLAIGIVGSLRQMLTTATLSCNREEGSCRLRVGMQTRRFAVTEIENIGVECSMRTLLGVGECNFNEDTQTFFPQIVLASGTIVLFEVDGSMAKQFFEQANRFSDDPSQASLSIELEPRRTSSVAQLAFVTPFALLFLIWGVRGGGGSVRIEIDDDTLRFQRRWGRVESVPVDELRGVKVEREGRRARVVLQKKDGGELPLTDRCFAPAAVHEDACQKLAAQLGLELPEPPPAKPPGSVSLGALVGGMAGVPFGFALFAACDLHLLIGDGKPDRMLFVGCLLVGVVTGGILGVRRAR